MKRVKWDAYIGEVIETLWFAEQVNLVVRQSGFIFNSHEGQKERPVLKRLWTGRCLQVSFPFARESCMLDLDAELVPGVEAAGIALGQPVELVLHLESPDAIEQRIGCRVLKYGAIWLFDEAGIVDQICVWDGYRGKIAGVIGIGSRIAEVEATFGPLLHIEQEEYQVDTEEPGISSNWCFSVEKGSHSMGEPGWGDARLCCICIMP
ncbi:MAG TPA: hypothetical protein VKU00_26410 [Chthonomonadaceae bacterium]|nr:hypothetical protein [Chthonomonadaceae bacterium]